MIKKILLSVFLSTSLMAIDSDDESRSFRGSSEQSTKTWLPDRQMTGKEKEHLNDLLIHIDESKKENVKRIVSEYFEKKLSFIRFMSIRTNK